MSILNSIREIQDSIPLRVGPDVVELMGIYAELEHIAFLAQSLQEKIAKRKAKLQNPIHFAEFE